MSSQALGTWLFILFVVLQLSSCHPVEPAAEHYALPAKVCKLPPELMEISGLATLDAHRVACVQDELGDIFFYGLENCELSNRISFGQPGDFEGLAIAGNAFYILRSDGMMFRARALTNGETEVEVIDTGIPAGDNEGLCFDEKNNRLLLTPKQKFTDKEFGKNYRAVYAYGLAGEGLIEEPVIRISVEEVLNFLQQETEIELPAKKKSGKVKFSFHIASIAVHPQEELYYLLISSERIVLVVDGNGKPLEAMLLNKKVLPKPEGITFLSDGVIAVSSEGDGGTPGIALFNLPLNTPPSAPHSPRSPAR